MNDSVNTLQNHSKINPPKNLKYDVAFIKNSGQNTLISIGRIDSNTVENPFDPRNVIT